MPVRQDGHLQDNTQMSKKILCRSCGAEYDGRETKCPWCGTRTDAGAEREYMDRLSDVKEDLESLSDIPGQNFRRNAGEQFRHLRGILIVALILFLIPAGMLVSGELRERGRAQGASKYIMSCIRICSPVAHCFIYGVFEGTAATGDRMNLSSVKLHGSNIGLLAANVNFAHVNCAVQS